MTLWALIQYHSKARRHCDNTANKDLKIAVSIHNKLHNNDLKIAVCIHNDLHNYDLKIAVCIHDHKKLNNILQIDTTAQ